MENQKTVCITGVGRGLGRALVDRYLLREDTNVIAVTRDPVKAIPEFADHPRLTIVVADIVTEAGRKRLAHVVEAAGGLDVLIHNAGRMVFKPFLDITGEELRSVYEVNVFAPFQLTQAVLPLCKACHVVNISSIGGVDGSLKFAGLSAYSSSKAALNNLTEMWSEEFKDSRHVFNCLAMGSIGTEMFREAFPGVSAALDTDTMADYVADFSFRAPDVMRGKIISLSISNP